MQKISVFLFSILVSELADQISKLSVINSLNGLELAERNRYFKFKYYTKVLIIRRNFEIFFYPVLILLDVNVNRLGVHFISTD